MIRELFPTLVQSAALQGLRSSYRGNALRTERFSASWKGSLHRRLQYVCVGIREISLHVGSATLCQGCIDAEPLQPRLSRRRTRDDSAVSDRRYRASALDNSRPGL